MYFPMRPMRPVLQPVAPVKVTARMEIDGEIHEVRYGPGEDFESPSDFFPPCKATLGLPCQAMLNLVQSSGLLEELPLDATKTLHVALPFCGSMQELLVLTDFFSRQVLGHRVNKIAILGSDLYDWNLKGGYWKQKELHIRRRQPGIDVRFCQLDLATFQHPPASLMFAIHPECTVQVDLWRKILSNIISACVGLCVVVTFSEDEAKVVSGVGQALHRRCQVHQNPYYQNSTNSSAGAAGSAGSAGTPLPPFMKFIVLLSTQTPPGG